MSDLPEGMTDADAMKLVVWGVRRFAGNQVIAFGQAWNMATGYAPDDIDPIGSSWLRWLLQELGYESQWVAELGRTKMQHLWVRNSWPSDFRANANREFKAFVSMS